jgi:hypothetical protein
MYYLSWACQELALRFSWIMVLWNSKCITRLLVPPQKKKEEEEEDDDPDLVTCKGIFVIFQPHLPPSSALNGVGVKSGIVSKKIRDKFTNPKK